MNSSTSDEMIYSVEHFYPKHPNHPVAPLTAETQGYFRDEGVGGSRLVIAGDNTGSITLLAAGETNISMDAHPAMLIEACAGGADLSIIGSYRNGLPFSIAAPPDTIRGARDLKGRRFTTNRRLGAGERMIRLAFSKLGMDPDRDLEIVLVNDEGVREKFAAIKEGRADFLVYHHNGPQGRVVKELIRKGELVEVMDLSKLIKSYVVRSIATTGRIIREKPEAIKGFIKGVMRAHHFLKHEDPTGMNSVEILKRALKVDSLAGSGVENGVPKSWAVEAKEIIADMEGIRVHVEELKTRGKIPKGFSAEQVVRNELGYEALKEL